MRERERDKDRRGGEEATRRDNRNARGKKRRAAWQKNSHHAREFLLHAHKINEQEREERNKI